MHPILNRIICHSDSQNCVLKTLQDPMTSKAVELQLQVKHNAEELQDFMRDLEHWEKDMKQKDLELRRQGGAPEEVSEGSLFMCSGTCLPSVCIQRVCAYTRASMPQRMNTSQRTPWGRLSLVGSRNRTRSQQACSKHFDLLSHVTVKCKI